jgi:predicted ATPase
MELENDQVWRYRLAFAQDEHRQPVVTREHIWSNRVRVLRRPDSYDQKDPSRLAQTHLEQVSANEKFRAISEFLAQVSYLHLVPLLVRDAERTAGKAWDAYGASFLNRLARVQSENRKTFASRLKRIQQALQVAVPGLEGLELARDGRGTAHLRGRYKHWRPNAGWQDESQFSDGTLRLVGLLWSLLDGTAPLLLEEPELSLHSGLVRHIPAMMARLARKTGRQVLLSTHSADLLSDEGIAPEEVLILNPTKEGTSVEVAADDQQVRELLAGGLTVADAVLPRTMPRDAEQLTLFGK